MEPMATAASEPREIPVESEVPAPEIQPNIEHEPGDSIRVRPGATMEEIEDAYISLVLQRTNNNKTKAADILGISVRTLHNRLGQLTKTRASSATG